MWLSWPLPVQSLREGWRPLTLRRMAEDLGPGAGVQAVDDGSGNQVDRRNLRTAAWGGLIGTALEQYDFVIYGTATAIVFQPDLLPWRGPGDRRHRRVRDLRGRLPGPPAGRAVLIPLRGPARTEVRAGRDPVRDGHLDVLDRSAAHVRAGG